MGRKPISEEVQNSVLLKSRRRCCLCFWLSGIDEVQKGQIAHLDQDNDNADEDNLVFLCFDHHDEYDGKTSQSKGLREAEVRKWRDELYRELESRFRTFRKKALSFKIENIGLTIDKSDKLILDNFALIFRLRNVGEAPIGRPIVSIELPENISAKREEYMQLPFGGQAKLPDFDIRGFSEVREDFFEPDGRVAQIAPLPPLDPLLLPEHSVKFDGLALSFRDYPPGCTISLGYRIDAENMEALIGTVETTVATALQEYLKSNRE